MKNHKKSSFKLRFPEFLLVVLLIFSGTMLAFNTGSFVVNFKLIGFTIFSSVEKGITVVTTSVKNTVLSIKELTEIHANYDILKERLADYEEMQRTNSDIRKENTRLKELLGFSDITPQKNYPASIISRGADNLYKTIVIDKGSKHGIKKNMPVIAIQKGNSGIVGKVVNVGYITSEVMPIFNLHSTISARIQNTRDIGFVTGTGTEDSPLAMTYIKKRVIDELHYGDVIVTSGENENYMKDMPIGTISKITVLDYDSSLDISLTPIIDFSRLEHVIVVALQNSKDVQ